MDETFRIKDLTKFAKKIGKTVALDSGFTIEDLKSYIKVSNIKQIILQHCVVDEQRQILINEEILKTICSDIFEWLMGTDLAKMASEDIIDCYWSDENNCIMFESKKKKKGKKNG